MAAHRRTRTFYRSDGQTAQMTRRQARKVPGWYPNRTMARRMGRSTVSQSPVPSTSRVPTYPPAVEQTPSVSFNDRYRRLYDENSRDGLRVKAADRNITGRGSMNKGQLATAIAQHDLAQA